MRHTSFDQLPESSRLYVFGASRPLSAAEADRLLARVDEFLDGWVAHGDAVAAARDWRLDRFLLVAADEAVTPLSGCSIDALTRQVKALEQELGLVLLDSNAIYFRREEGVVRLPRAEFARLVESGEVDAGTMVFDNTIRRMEQLRRGEWERPFAGAWHARAFPLPSRGVPASNG